MILSWYQVSKREYITRLFFNPRKIIIQIKSYQTHSIHLRSVVVDLRGLAIVARVARVGNCSNLRFWALLLKLYGIELNCIDGGIPSKIPANLISEFGTHLAPDFKVHHTHYHRVSINILR